MKNGIKENGNSKKKILISALIFLALVGVIVYTKFGVNDVSFKENDEKFFKIESELLSESEYKIESLDAYYLEDTKMYYYEIKYQIYIDVDGMGWSDIDNIRIGKEGIFTDMFCLNWKASDLEDYKEEIKEFERAKKQGVHKTYDVNDVVEKIKKMQK